MFMFLTPASRRLFYRRLLLAPLVVACSAALLAGLWVSAASATPYGQISRFGGFDETGSVPGKFVLPVGFAVDPSESNDVYVLDRVVDEERESSGTFQYRLQKLSSTGTLIASVLLPPEHYATASREGAHPLIGLAIDSTSHRVYTLVQSIVSDGGAEQSVPVVESLVAWSTNQNGKELVKAPGFKETDVITGGALVAGPSVLESAEASKDLYLPQTLTVDHSQNIVIQAQDGVEPGPKGGPMILQQVKVQGPEGQKVGALGEHFTAESVIAPQSQVGDGLFTTQSGSLGLDMWAGGDRISRLATIQATLKEPKPELVAEDESEDADRDGAVSIDERHTIAYQGEFGNSFVLKPYKAGSPMTQLTSGLYAALYAEGFDQEQGSEYPGNRFETSPFWYQGVQVFKSVAREGVRLFDKKGKINTTLGAENEGEPCYIGFAAVALAAGTGETVFALEQPNPEDENKGDEVIEFGPDTNPATQCPTDKRQVEVNGEISESVTTTETAKVSFAAKLSNPGADTPYEFEWNFGDGKTEVKTMEAGNSYHWPEPTTEHQYAKHGVYHASLRIYGAFGTSEVPIEVIVNQLTSPTAEFDSPGGPAEEQVAFSASGSIALAGTKIEKYIWSFGDGSSEVSTPNAAVKHIFAKPGSYPVRLKVVDLGQSSEVTHTIVVSESAKEKTEREEGEQRFREQEQRLLEQKEREESETRARTASAEKAAAEKSSAEKASAEKAAAEKAAAEAKQGVAATKKTSTKPPTRAQLLARALKRCKKEPKKKRAKCEASARKKYGPKPKHKSSKKR